MYSLPHAPCCSACKWFRPMDLSEAEAGIEIDADEDVELKDYGRCVRYPPTFFHIGLLNAEFPVVSGEMVCGEFRRNIE